MALQLLRTFEHAVHAKRLPPAAGFFGFAQKDRIGRVTTLGEGRLDGNAERASDDRRMEPANNDQRQQGRSSKRP